MWLMSKWSVMRIRKVSSFFLQVCFNLNLIYVCRYKSKSTSIYVLKLFSDFVATIFKTIVWLVWFCDELHYDIFSYVTLRITLFSKHTHETFYQLWLLKKSFFQSCNRLKYSILSTILSCLKFGHLKTDFDFFEFNFHLK